MASWPWAPIAKPLGQPLDDFPNVARWRELIKQRPAVQAGRRFGQGVAPLGRRRATRSAGSCSTKPRGVRDGSSEGRLLRRGGVGAGFGDLPPVPDQQSRRKLRWPQ